MSRQARQEEVAQERRRRQPGTLNRMEQLSLAVPAEVRERHPDCEFRWVNDQGNRMYALTQQDDWDKVEGVNPIPVGTDKEGKPLYAHLCKKKRSFFEHDQREKLGFIKQREAALVKQPEQSEADPKAYALEGNSITTGFTP